MSDIAIIRIRSAIRASQPVRDTLQNLSLARTNYCVVIEDSPVNRGMIAKVKDFVTWGDIDDETKAALKAKTEKKYVRLHPPRGGFERKGIKKHFSIGGALGERKEKINDLVKKML